ncbi:MAG: DUF3108 domain-containing protein [Pseudomonadota bacterium]|nr:DUF3108 domain-containing protein [Pseudomonadota bacterium]
MPNYLHALLAGLLAASLAAPARAQSLPLPPYEARYQVYAAGIPLGEAVVTLKDEGNGRYSMSSRVQPNDFAALLVSDRISEQASGEFRKDNFRPLSYEQRHQDGKETNVTTLAFDWKASKLKARHNAEQATLPLTADVVDPLSLHLAARWDLKSGRTPDRYTIVDDTELKTYQIRMEGKETLKTPLGALETQRVSQQKPGSSRVTTFWFAPALDYLVVQVAQRKDGKEVLRMVIQDARGVERK